MTHPAQSSPPTSSNGAPDRPPGRQLSTADDPAGQQLAAIGHLTDRRAMLKVVGLGVGVAAGAGVLAACSSPPVQPDPEAKSPAGPSTSDGGPAKTATSGSPSSSAAAAGGTPTSKIPVKGGTIFADTKTVVTQPSAGTFKAFDATCPHAGCTVAKVADGRIDCPCHGSQFDISTGDRVAGPAPTGLTPKKITVTGQTFTVA